MFIKEKESVSRFEVKRQGYTLVLEVSSDALECICIYEPSNLGGTPLTKPELLEHLAQFKVTEGLIPESVATLLVSAVSGQAVKRLLLCRGIPMIPGEDGKHVLCTPEKPVEVVEPDKGNSGTVDFRNVQSFLNVDDGDLIATIIPPGAGTSGRTVTGKIIPPQPGARIMLGIGQNARLSEDGTKVFAAGTGRVCVRDNVILVDDVYVVAGSVDFKVGNIVFKGYVEVKGDVLDGFSIKATRGIKIQGNIGVCSIESEGDISFCGMSGQGTGSIKCGGSITANFIYDSLIECAGSVTADVEIRNSQIKSLGVISVNKGGLAGGEYFALAGIECVNLGSKTSLRTRVVAGIHYRDLEELSELFNELKSMVAEYSAAPKGTVDLKEFAKKRAVITERTQEVRARTYEKCNPKINVTRMLYEGVTITLGIISDNSLGERKGPMSVIENTIEGGFRFLGMTSIAFKAQQIEQTFIQQDLLDKQKKSVARTGESE